MSRWDAHFIQLARHCASVSKDPKCRVGAVIVDTLRRAVGSGYNGFPRGVRDLEERYADKRVKEKLVVHAEANAILNSVARTDGCVIYTTRMPCSGCAKLIIQAGITRVVCLPYPASGEDEDDSAFSLMMFKEAGVVADILDDSIDWKPEWDD